MMKTVTTQVRGLPLNLVAYTRALELCARMNRETEVLDFIDCIPKGRALFDLGACEGRFSVYAALRGVNCFAFEPEDMNYEALTRNAEINPDSASCLTTFKVAVGEWRHATTIKIGQPWAGGHHKVISDADSRTDLNFNFTGEQPVEIVSLDEFIKENNLPQPDYMKVDIDGSELSFLRGAQRTLSNGGLRAIIFELYENDASYEEVTKFLASAGFEVVTKHEVEAGLFNIVFHRSGISN